MKIVRYMLILALATGILSCEKEGDFLTASALEGVTLDGGSDDIILSIETANELALTIHWTDNGHISLSNPNVLAPKNAVINTIQLSGDAEFSTVVEQRAEDGIFHHQFTHYELNALLSRLGMEGGVTYPLYIRVKSKIGDNVSPVYSDALTMNVTPYLIDMSIGYILDSSKEETGRSLYSATSNGIYEGFLGVTAWYNWYLREGEGTTWGNIGVDGSEFILSNEATTHWNFWFPGQSGSYYTVVNTALKEWSALWIPNLSVSGDVEGEMVFDRLANRWTYSFTHAAGGSVNVILSGTGKQNDRTTATDDAAAADTPVGFSGTADNIIFGSEATSITVPVSGTGEVSLILDLSNPKQWTLSVTEGSSEPVEIPPLVYISGIDDGLSGSWTFDNYLRLYSEDDLGYGGAANVHSLWGYKFYDEVDNWSDAYGMAEGGTPFEGTLVFGGENNIAAPDPGLYIIEMSKKWLTYKLTPVTSISYTGLNDDWSLHPMHATATPGVFTAEVTIASPSPWGFQIIINEDWNLVFGGGEGKLVLHGSNITDDAALPAGTYTLTVDICKQTLALE